MSATLAGGAALSAGGMVANSIASNKAAAAHTQALQGNAMLQAPLDARISADHAAELAPYSNFGAGRDAKESQLAGLFNSGLVSTATGPNAPVGALPTASSPLIAGEDARRAAQAATFSTGQGKALGALRASGETLGDANVERAKAAQDIGLQNSFKIGYQNLLPGALDAANQQGAGMRTLGDLLKGTGGLAVSAGLKGLNAAKLPTGILPPIAKFTSTPVGAIETPNAMTSASALGSAFSLY